MVWNQREDRIITMQSNRPRRLFFSLCAASVLLAAGCGDDSTSADGGGTVTPDGSTADGASPIDGSSPDGSVNPGPGGDSYRLEWGPITAQPSEEDTRCVLRRLPTSAPIRVGQLINQLGGFSHHMIVYRTNDTEERLEPYPCDPFTDTLDPSRGAPLTVTQRGEETITLPDGVAYTLEPGQMIRIELHYINYSAEAVELSASTTLVTVPEADFEFEADFLFIGNIDIDLDPRSPATVGPAYLALPPQLEGVNFFSITGHTHQWGTNVSVDVAASSDDPGRPVYDVAGWNWDEPDTIYHEPPFQVPSGGGFRFACDYENRSDQRVGFGESANDEMCFFWTYYYPSQGSQVCFASPNLSVEACCPGSPLCGVLLGP